MKAIGLDIGTAFIASATYGKSGNTTARYVRDGFFKMKAIDQREAMLQMSKIAYVKKDKDLYVIGNEAFDMAVLFSQELRRPLADGVISSKEVETEFILKEIIRRVAGDGSQGDIAYYSIPANPVDQSFNNIYHREMFRRFLESFGYQAVPLNEGMAVAYSELADQDFTGLAMSAGAGMCNVAMSYKGMEIFSFSVARCLHEDTPVWTSNRGEVCIKDVVPGRDSVVDGLGNICSVLSKIDNGIKDNLLGITLKGYSEQVRMTNDHQVLVKEGINWEWCKAEDLKVGDVVGEPVVRCTSPITRFYFGTYTVEKGKYRTVETMASRNLGRFIGMFLGDGCAVYNGSKGVGQYYVSLAFNEDKPHLIEKYESVLKKLFPEGTNIRRSSHGKKSKVINLIITDKAVSKKMLEFYGDNHEKLLPIPLSNVPNNVALGILEGLLDSDGCVSDENISFSNTSSNLAWLVRQLAARVGIVFSLRKREPRAGGINSKGVRIQGKLDTYECKLNTISEVKKLLSLFSDYEGNGVYVSNGLDFIPSNITVIDKITEATKVYDLSIASNHHSFALPNMTVHNCGDWIDKQVSQVRGIPTSDAAAEKEKPQFDLLDPKDEVEQAIQIYYRAMLEYVVGHIVDATETHKRKIKLKDKLSFVVAGGTSMPKGFLQMLARVLKANPLPIPVGKVWQSKNPVMSVCKGCLIAAQKELKKDGQDGSRDISDGDNKKHQYPKPVTIQDTSAEQKPAVAKTPKDLKEDKEKGAVMAKGLGHAEAIDLGEF